MAAGSDRSIPAAQAWAVSRQNDDPVTGDAASGGGLGDVGQTGHVHPETEAAPRRILEDDRWRIGSAIDLGEHERKPVRQPLRPGLDAGAAVRADVDVDEPPGEPRRGSQIRREDLDRAAEEVLLGTGEVDEVGGMDRDRPDVELGQAGTERGGFGRGLGAASPGGRVVDEDLERLRPDLVRAIDRPDHAVAERQVRAEASSVGKHPGMVRERPFGGCCIAADATFASYGGVAATLRLTEAAARARVAAARRRRTTPASVRSRSGSRCCSVWGAGGFAAALGVVAADDWFDEAVVVVVAAVEDGDALGLGVDEDEELVAELVHRGDGVLLEHRLDVEALDLDDAWVAARPSEPSARRRRICFSSSGRARRRGFSLCSTACRSTLSTTSSSASW